jgi:hypothetical protein
MPSSPACGPPTGSCSPPPPHIPFPSLRGSYSGSGGWPVGWYRGDLEGPVAASVIQHRACGTRAPSRTATTSRTAPDGGDAGAGDMPCRVVQRIVGGFRAWPAGSPPGASTSPLGRPRGMPRAGRPAGAQSTHPGTTIYARLIAATASLSARSFIGSPTWPRTYLNVTVLPPAAGRAARSSSISRHSAALAGLLRLKPPSSQPMTFLLSALRQRHAASWPR